MVSDHVVFKDQLDAELDYIGKLLVSKNKAYGNSALDPVRIFSKADPIEQLNVRIDDKLSRLSRGEELNEDTELDLLGYLLLRRIALRTSAMQELNITPKPFIEQ